MTHTDHGILDKLDAFLEANLDNLGLPSDVVCKKIGLSRSQLHRIVKEKTGLSITLYLRQKRLAKASRPIFYYNPANPSGFGITSVNYFDRNKPFFFAFPLTSLLRV